ncbi:hypothetical protein BDR26DRAFT_650274 [Obelidium mucronatum]|nr:hypothetical protein BDR26DRAFT_650274 [Obelidium mucronatum]
MATRWVQSLFAQNTVATVRSTQQLKTFDLLRGFIRDHPGTHRLLNQSSVWILWNETAANPTIHPFAIRRRLPSMVLPDPISRAESKDLIRWLTQTCSVEVCDLANKVAVIGNVALLDLIAEEYPQDLRGYGGVCYTRESMLQSVVSSFSAVDGAKVNFFAQDLHEYQSTPPDHQAVEDVADISILDHILNHTFKLIGAPYSHDDDERVVIPDDYDASKWQVTKAEMDAVLHTATQYRFSTRLLQHLVQDLKFPLNPDVFNAMDISEADFDGYPHFRYLLATGDEYVRALIWARLNDAPACSLASVIYPYCIANGWNEDGYSDTVWNLAKDAVSANQLLSTQLDSAIRLVKKKAENEKDEQRKLQVEGILAT